MGLLAGNDDGQKPLARKYFNQLKKEGVPSEDRKSTVEFVKISGSGEWVIVEAQECVALINANSKVGEQFWEFVQTLHGKELSGLEIYAAKGKLGFDIQPNHAVTGYWSYESSEDKVEFGSKKSSGNSGLMNLTIDAMTPKSVSMLGNTGDKHGSGVPSTVSTSMNTDGGEKPSRKRSGASQTDAKGTDD